MPNFTHGPKNQKEAARRATRWTRGMGPQPRACGPVLQNIALGTWVPSSSCSHFFFYKNTGPLFVDSWRGPKFVTSTRMGKRHVRRQLERARRTDGLYPQPIRVQTPGLTLYFSYLMEYAFSGTNR